MAPHDAQGPASKEADASSRVPSTSILIVLHYADLCTRRGRTKCAGGRFIAGLARRSGLSSVCSGVVQFGVLRSPFWPDGCSLSNLLRGPLVTDEQVTWGSWSGSLSANRHGPLVADCWPSSRPPSSWIHRARRQIDRRQVLRRGWAAVRCIHVPRALAGVRAIGSHVRRADPARHVLRPELQRLA